MFIFVISFKSVLVCGVKDRSRFFVFVFFNLGSQLSQTIYEKTIISLLNYVVTFVKKKSVEHTYVGPFLDLVFIDVYIYS